MPAIVGPDGVLTVDAHLMLLRMAEALEEAQGLIAGMGDDMSDIAQAERVVLSTYGDTVSVEAKGKNLNKFGRNLSVGSSYETVAEFQGTVANETFVSTNLIDSVSSSSASDTTQTIRVEGHVIDGSGNLTFTAQEVALNGQTKVALPTPLARATRANVQPTGAFGSEPAALVGTVSVYDDTDGITAGVPNTDAAAKVLISAGESQSEKASTTISVGDYWFIKYISAGIGDAGSSANFVTVRMEARDVANGGAWRPMGKEVVLVPSQTGVSLTFDPLLIVPKNHDWRFRAKTDTNTAEVFAEAGGVLAVIQ